MAQERLRLHPVQSSKRGRKPLYKTETERRAAKRQKEREWEARNKAKRKQLWSSPEYLKKRREYYYANKAKIDAQNKEYARRTYLLRKIHLVTGQSYKEIRAALDVSSKREQAL